MKQAILVAMLWVGSAMASVAQSLVYQLRIYKLHPGNEAHFHDRFRDQCIPIMKRCGFDIVFASQSGASGHAGIRLSAALERSCDPGPGMLDSAYSTPV